MMRRLQVLFLYSLLFIPSVCYENRNDKILGDWLLRTDYEAPDSIIFRSDGTYLVYNDMDYIGLEYSNRSDIKLDNNSSVTALTEIGKWNYNFRSGYLKLTERKFVLEDSEFNQFHGKDAELTFKLKSLTDQEMVLCSCSKKKNCDTYVKREHLRYLSKKQAITFYREINEEYCGEGIKTISISLSGTEIDLKLKKITCTSPFQLIVENRNEQQIGILTNSSNHGEHELQLRGVTRLVLKMCPDQLNAQWRFEVEIK